MYNLQIMSSTGPTYKIVRFVKHLIMSIVKLYSLLIRVIAVVDFLAFGLLAVPLFCTCVLDGLVMVLSCSFEAHVF